MRLAAATFLLALAPFSAHAIEATAGGSGTPLTYAGGAGVEVDAAESLGLEITGGFYGFRYSTADYQEAGGGPGGGVRLRWYAQNPGNATRLWLGGGVAAANIHYTWEEADDAGEIIDEEDETAVYVLPSFALGYKKLVFDERMVLDPQLSIGYFVNAETETRIFAGLGLSLGWRF